eukprot:256135_1
MEKHMLQSAILYLQSQGIHPQDISIDGDSKIPGLVLSINAIALKLFDGLPIIGLSSDISHSKKNTVKHIFGFNSEFIWDIARRNEYDIRGFTFEYCKLLVDRLFQYSFHNDRIKSVETAI